LARGETVLDGALFSRDTELMGAALNKLGIICESDPTTHQIRVSGCGGQLPEASAELFVGNAGTAARFLPALLATRVGGDYQLDGDPAMRRRPIAPLLDALVALGAVEVTYLGDTGFFPFRLRTHGFAQAANREVEVDASASSQILSALLMASPVGAVDLIRLRCPEVRPAYIEITLRMAESFGGGRVKPDAEGVYELVPQVYAPPESGTYAVEPDLSAASYFLAHSQIHGSQLHLARVGAEPLQGDRQFADLLAEHHGLRIDRDHQGGWQVSGPSDCEVGEGAWNHDFNHFSDTFLTYAAISPLFGAPEVVIRGIRHTRHQETDRVAGIANELRKLGQPVDETDDSLTIRPDREAMRAVATKAVKAGQLIEIDTYEDHRFAMSFGILGTHDLLGTGQPWLAIRDPACCGKTFPEFFSVLEKLR